MKHLSLLLLLFVSVPILAQNPNAQSKTPEQRAEGLTKRWTKALTLTTEQQPKVKAVFLERAQKVDAIKAKYASSQDKKASHQELKNVRDTADQSLKQILTPEQYAKYEQRKEEKKQQAKSKKGKGAPVPVDEDDE